MAYQDRSPDVRIEVITNPDDLRPGYEVAQACFGEQTHDGFWEAATPGGNTPEGIAAGVERTKKRFNAITKNKDGQPNLIFLKAVSPENGQDKVVGYAIWWQLSQAEGYGDNPPETINVEELSDDPKQQRYIQQLFTSLFAHRQKMVKEKATADPPAYFALDLCAVSPEYQGRGIARKLVQWGLNESKNRGNLECAMEASVMGQPVYRRAGFTPVADIVWNVDEEFKQRVQPPNKFMRTGVKQS